MTAEVDCQSLFSEANQVAAPRRAQTRIKTYKDLVAIKHHLGRIYCDIPNVKAMYLKKWKANDWDKEENADSNEFLETEKEPYRKMFPNDNDIFADLEEGKDEGSGDDILEGVL